MLGCLLRDATNSRRSFGVAQEAAFKIMVACVSGKTWLHHICLWAKASPFASHHVSPRYVGREMIPSALLRLPAMARLVPIVQYLKVFIRTSASSTDDQVSKNITIRCYSLQVQVSSFQLAKCMATEALSVVRQKIRKAYCTS